MLQHKLMGEGVNDSPVEKWLCSSSDLRGLFPIFCEGFPYFVQCSSPGEKGMICWVILIQPESKSWKQNKHMEMNPERAAKLSKKPSTF